MQREPNILVILIEKMAQIVSNSRADWICKKFKRTAQDKQTIIT